MKVIVQTAQSSVTYRSYEVEAADVVAARKVIVDGLTPLGERTLVTRQEHCVGAARKDYLVDGLRYDEYIRCEEDLW